MTTSASAGGPEPVEEMDATGLLVLFRAGVSSSTHASAMAEAGAGEARAVSPLAPGLERWEVGRSGVAAAVARLRADPAVVFAEPDLRIEPAAVSTDPYYLNLNGTNLWGMHGDAIGPNANPHGSGADEAWATGHVGSRSVAVGIVDQGLQHAHPDLEANVWTNPFDPVDGVDNDGNGYVDDVHGWDFANDDASTYDGPADDHGTHVAGTIGAEGGNGIGVAGVAWEVALISAKFLGADGGLVSDAVAALDYLTDLKARHGIDVVATNNSWRMPGFSQALLDAIQRGGDRDIVFVAAAGNAALGNDTYAEGYPSNYECTTRADTGEPRGWDCVVAVAALTSSGALSSISSYGARTVDLGAPGAGIASTVPDGAYRDASGTSMATAHVSGAAALCASIDPAMRGASLREALVEATTSTASLAGVTVTGGRLNAGALPVRCAPATGPVGGGPTELTATATGTSRIQLAWTDGAIGEQTYEIERSGDPSCAGGFAPYATVAADSTTFLAAGLEQSSTWCFRVRAANGFAGGSASDWAATGPVTTAAALTPYECAPTAYAWVDATLGTRRTLADDASLALTLPFSFRFYGMGATSARLSSNGFLRFGSGQADAFVNQPIPTPIEPNGFAAAFWDDLDPAAGGSVWTRTVGTSPNRRYVASWNDVPIFNRPGTAVSVQVVLEEATGAVVFQYRDVVAGDPEHDLGASATVGIETPEGNAGTQVGVDSPVLADAAAIRCAQPVPTITTTSLPTATAGVPYTATVSATGGRVPYAWSWSGTTTPGLALDPTTGTIAGTPTSGGTYSVMVTVGDAGGMTATRSLTLKVAFSKLAPADRATAGVAAGIPLSWSANRNAARYEWCVSTTTTCPTTKGPAGTGWISATGLTATLNRTIWSNLTPGRTYYWQVRAVTSGGTRTTANNGTWWRFTTSS